MVGLLGRPGARLKEKQTKKPKHKMAFKVFEAKELRSMMLHATQALARHTSPSPYHHNLETSWTVLADVLPHHGLHGVLELDASRAVL
eukprot:m.79932 g.79932  ORF g.79932 m.79932 type:complete len:88 (+) comp14644_c0_seq1:697-960(+)